MKQLKKSFVFFIILVLILPLLSFATNQTESLEDFSNTEIINNNSVASFNTQSVEPNTDFYLILNLSQITFNKFKVEISNSANLSSNKVTQTVSELSTTTNATSFIVDKTLINLDKLGIVYTSSAQETNLVFTIIITDLETEETLQAELKSLKDELVNLENTLNGYKQDLEKLEQNNTDENSEEYQQLSKNITELSEHITEKNTKITSLSSELSNFSPKTLEYSATLIVREDSVSEDDKNINSEDKKPWDDKDSLLEDMDEKMNKEMASSMKKMMAEMSELEFNLKSANNTISSLTQNITYQGSQNNYLESLSISGIELKNNFKKTTLDYFATVDKNVTSVTVNAVAEDNSAIVTIYGNTNLKSGKNKVLITVTADDGSIRTYKIYISK